MRGLVLLSVGIAPIEFMLARGIEVIAEISTPTLARRRVQNTTAPIARHFAAAHASNVYRGARLARRKHRKSPGYRHSAHDQEAQGKGPLHGVFLVIAELNPCQAT